VSKFPAWLIAGSAALAAIAVAAVASEPTPYLQAMAPYFEELRRDCPDKRLEDLSPADLDDLIADYERAMPAPVRQRMEASAGSRCAGSIAGASCGNVARISTLAGLGLHHELARAVCRTPKVCIGPSDCRPAG
jgi:hypothetical protein